MMLKRLSSVCLGLGFVALVGWGSGLAQGTPPGVWERGDRTAGVNVLEVFEEVSALAENSVFVVFEEPRTQVGLVTAVADGLVVGKATELGAREGELHVRNARHRRGSLDLLAVDLENDLALFSTDVADLVPANWSLQDPQRADWVISFSDRLNAARNGVISANSRAVDSAGAYLGVVLELVEEVEDWDGSLARVTEVGEGSAAEMGGILAGDFLVGVDGQRFDSPQDLSQFLQGYIPGSEVMLIIYRDGQLYETSVELGYRATMRQQETSNAALSGRASLRQNGFGRVHQHTCLVAPSMMGGPLLNLEGEVIGVNIARVNHTATMALAPEQVLASLLRMQERGLDEAQRAAQALIELGGRERLQQVVERQQQLRAQEDAARDQEDAGDDRAEAEENGGEAEQGESVQGEGCEELEGESAGGGDRFDEGEEKDEAEEAA